MATWVGRGGICLTAFNSPTPKTPAACKNLGDISRTSRDIAVFVSNFVAVATGVGRGRICLTSSIAQPPKPPTIGANISVIFPIKVSFVPNFVAMTTRVCLFKISPTSFDSLTPGRKPPVRRTDLGDISYTSRDIADFMPWQQGSSEGKFK